MYTGRSDKVRTMVQRLLTPSNDTPPIDVEQITLNEGIRIRYELLEDTVSGMLVIRDGIPTIAVNAAHHRNRQRFTIAHELGHYFLHRAQSNVFIDAVYFRDETSAEGVRQQEIAANTFAAELLMPEALMRETFTNQPVADPDDTHLRTVAERFEVSVQALTIRLAVLGIINV